MLNQGNLCALPPI